MKVVLAVALAAGVVTELLPPPATSSTYLSGYASAYAPGVMDQVVRYRLDNDVWRVDPPADWYTVHGYVAAMDCARVGEVATLRAADGREYRVLISDCAGDDGPADRFEKMSIIVELDWRLWTSLVAEHGRPLAVELER